VVLSTHYKTSNSLHFNDAREGGIFLNYFISGVGDRQVSFEVTAGSGTL
jgi:hypothetical protein